MPKRHRHGTSATRVLSHLEEVVLATSGEDAFEMAFAVTAARLLTPSGATVARRIEAAAKSYPVLDVARAAARASDELLARVDALVGRALPDDDTRHEALDALFEALVSKVSKADKGQFFTPRNVVAFVVRALGPEAGETVADPACGSGAFLAQARAEADVSTIGQDVDARAIRVARLLALAQGRDPSTLVRADALAKLPAWRADVVATNPPFAGRADPEGFAVAAVVRSPERDVLFLERALELLRPEGRMGIVLPYNKAGGEAYADLRRWLVERARVAAVVGLPRETFLPHTSQRTFALFLKKRRRGERPSDDEKTMFVVSERAAKDAAGEPRTDAGDDLDEVLSRLVPFLRSEGFRR